MMKTGQSGRSSLVRFCCVILIAGCLGLSVSGCSKPTQPTGTDIRLVGLWANKAGQIQIALNEKGEPATLVPVGEWFEFDASGRYFKAARHMTFAIGGVSVEEGIYTSQGNNLRLTRRTESFFPDQGSPQQAKYRGPLADEASVYRIDSKEGSAVLYLSSGMDQPETAFFPVKK
jgi:hypothetical protein